MAEKIFIPLSFTVLTVSDTRDDDNDTSGNYLASRGKECGHILVEKTICKDNIYAIRSIVSRWIFENGVQVIMLTGGTGLFDSDRSPEAVQVLFDKTIDGFGELFRMMTYQEIGTSTIQSRVIAGIANKTLVFVLPGSTHACKLGWSIIEEQLDASKKQCSFVNVITKDEKNI